MADRTPEPPSPRRQRSVVTALIILAILAVVAAAKIAASFLIPIVVGILASYSLKPLVAGLERIHIHRAIGAALVLAVVSSVFVGGVFLLRDDATAAVAELPAAARKLRMAARENAQQPASPLGHVRAAAQELDKAAVEAASGGAPAPEPVPAPAPTELQKWLSEQSAKALDVVIEIGIAGLLAYFLLAAGDAFRRKVVHVAGPTLAARRITVEILDEIDAQVQRYLVTMMIINILVGIATWGILVAFGVKHAALWGVVAAVLHIVPYAGSALTIVATGFAAFIQFEEVGRSLLVAFAVAVAATVIGMGLAAWIQGRAFRMNAVTVFIALLFFGWLWGGWGLLVGVPLLAIVKTTIDRVPSLERFMTLISDEPRPPVVSPTATVAERHLPSASAASSDGSHAGSASAAAPGGAHAGSASAASSRGAHAGSASAAASGGAHAGSASAAAPGGAQAGSASAAPSGGAHAGRASAASSDGSHAISETTASSTKSSSPGAAMLAVPPAKR